MTETDTIAEYLEDAFALHPGHMTASGLVARLRDAGYAIVPAKDLATILNPPRRMVDTTEMAAAREVLWTAADAVLNPT